MNVYAKSKIIAIDHQILYKRLHIAKMKYCISNCDLLQIDRFISYILENSDEKINLWCSQE